MSDYRPLPTAIEEITPAWLTAALRSRAPDATVLGSTVTKMYRSTCTKVWITLELDEAGKAAGIPDHVILKGGFEPHSRHMDYMHEKEVRWYRDILPDITLPSPASYFADFDPDNRQGIVIMEDLGPRGVTFCDPLVPQTHDQVARRLAALARYHAQTWDSPEFAAGGKLDWVTPAIRGEISPYLSQFMKPDVWERFIRSPRGAAVSVQFHDLEWMRSALLKMGRLVGRLPHVLLHCDTHLGNLYNYADGEPGFLDSQPNHGPAMIEVAYHMSCALDPGDRGRWEGALIRHYVDELVRQGIDAPSFEEAMRQYGIFLAFAYCVFIINDAVFQLEQVNTAYTARIGQAMLANNTIELLNSIEG